MENGFDKWKRKMDEGRLNDILPGFDTNNAWKELAPKLKKKEKNPFRLWAYAATLAAILLGGLLLKTAINKDTVTNNSITVSTQTQPQSSPIIITKTDTVIKTVVVNNTITPVKKKRIKPGTTITSEPILAVEKKLVPEEHKAAIETKENMLQPIVAKAQPKPKVRAVHLLDINNEDRQIVIQDAGESQSLQERIGYYLSSPGRISNSNPDNSPNGIKSLFQ